MVCEGPTSQSRRVSAATVSGVTTARLRGRRPVQVGATSTTHITEVDTVLRARLREISAKHPRWGWRKAHALCRGGGLVTNHKRTQRLWREKGLKRPPRARKKRRIGLGGSQ
ncbi:IS3 family transposase [Nocardia fluminea]|uniref:IS3 family transposase n=1 Tax=Nocardia fluminea TaxID=134984 RepID=UPI0037B47A04